MTQIWNDSRERYGRVTRVLHWTMAALFAWQFMGMVVKLTVGKSPVTAFFVGTHVTIGSVLFVLIVLRAVWGLCQLGMRPPHDAGWRGRAAVAGHLALYVLMLVVPTLAVLRQLGSGKGYTVFGIPLLGPTGTAIEWMIRPAQLLHGVLAWVLLALIAGHIVMVLVHRYVWRDDVLERMIGKTAV